MRLIVRVMIAVHKGAGERNMSAEIRCLLGPIADFSHLVLHCVHFLHWGVTGVAGVWSAGLKIWQGSVHEQNTSINAASWKTNTI